MRGLNLGAGRAQFPTTPHNPFTSHVAWGLAAACPAALDPSAEWVNADKADIPGVDRVVNLFRYPFLDNRTGRVFPDEEFDVIWCGHIIEHIPHNMKLSNAPNAVILDMYDKDTDGWFAFFYECWRVLKPDGRLSILSPWGLGISGMTDPTHTRYITPGSFSYFEPNPDAPFDYQIPFAFKLDTFNGQPVVHMKLVDIAAGLLTEMEEVVKIANPTDEDRAHKAELDSQLSTYTRHHIGYVDEICYRFVKVAVP